MRRASLGAIACAFGLVGLTPAGGWAQEAQRTRALLVGVSRYPQLAERWWLDGPANDVKLFQSFLTGDNRFVKVDPRDVTALAGWPSDPKQRPTKANIAAAFRRLADPSVTRPGDQVVILMAGHGSQMPAAPDDPEEPDGFDEIFLPADVARWDGSKGGLPNAITDNEIREWLGAIRRAGAFVWIVFDSCHSGTMTRGFERPREMHREQLGIPAGTARSRGTAAPGSFDVKDEGIVAMYAAQPSEMTPEKQLPEGGSLWHGVFSYYLLETLQQAVEPLTYRELAERIHERYRSLGRIGPTPAVEGTATDRRVLGRDRLAARPALLLGSAAKDGTWTLHAGRLHGLHPGAVLAVHPPAGAAGGDSPVGYVRVASAEPTSAAVEPVEHAGMPRPSATGLVAGSRCRVVVHALESRPLTIGLDPSLTVPALVEAARQALSGLAATSLGTARAATDGLDFVLEHENGEWLLSHVSSRVEVARGDSAAGSAAGQAPSTGVARPPSGERIVVAPAGSDEFGDRLGDIAYRLSRVTQLRRLGAASSAGGAGPRLEVQAYPAGGTVPIAFGERGRELKVGQEVEFRVRNTSDQALDLAVLFLAGNHGIAPIYPVAGKQMDSLLAPGREVVVYRGKITGDTVGDEDLVVIGLPPRQPPVNLTVLAAPGMEMRPRASRGPAERERGPGETGLAALVADALRGRGRTRGLDDQQLATDAPYSISIFSWTTVR